MSRSVPTDADTASPTDADTASPTDADTASPTDADTASPTDADTASPTDAGERTSMLLSGVRQSAMSIEVRGWVEAKGRMMSDDATYGALLSLELYVIWADRVSEHLFGLGGGDGGARFAARGVPKDACEPVRVAVADDARHRADAGEGAFGWTWARWGEVSNALRELDDIDGSPWATIERAVEALLAVPIGQWGWPFARSEVRVIVWAVS